MIVWFIQWVIVLIPVYNIVTYKNIDKKCKKRWAWITFGVPLLLTWIADFAIIIIEGEVLPYKFMYKYSSVPFWIWVLSAWGLYLYFRYKVKNNQTCKKQAYTMKEVS